MGIEILKGKYKGLWEDEPVQKDYDIISDEDIDDSFTPITVRELFETIDENKKIDIVYCWDKTCFVCRKGMFQLDDSYWFEGTSKDFDEEKEEPIGLDSKVWKLKDGKYITISNGYDEYHYTCSQECLDKIEEELYK